jgi:hypothetical protein
MGIRLALGNKVGNVPLVMADPGDPWEATDVVSSPRLPRRRFISSGISRDLCVVFYEVGGRGHSFHVAITVLEGSEWRFAWQAVASRKVDSVAALNVALRKGELNDDSAYDDCPVLTF